jgi:hypothetical protein
MEGDSILWLQGGGVNDWNPIERPERKGQSPMWQASEEQDDFIRMPSQQRGTFVLKEKTVDAV